MDLESRQAQIDDLDDQILVLLNRRARLDLEMARMQSGEGGRALDTGREREVLERACLANDGPLDSRAVRSVFRRILSESRRLAARLGGERKPAASTGRALSRLP